MTYGVNDSIGDLVLFDILKFGSLQPCSDLEEVIDPPSQVKNFVEDNTELTKLHHTSSVDSIPSCINLEEDICHKGTNHSSKDVSLPTSLLEKEDVVNDSLLLRKSLLRHFISKQWLFQVLNQ